MSRKKIADELDEQSTFDSAREGQALDIESRLESEISELENSESAPIDAPLIKAEPKKKTAKSKNSVKVFNSSDFFGTNFKHLDKDLSQEERDEWNEIYASFRSESILTDAVIGVDQYEMPVKNDAGITEMRKINCLVIIKYRIKVIIPENMVWVDNEQHGTFLMRGMIGANIDYVITSIDREGEYVLASRAKALPKRRRAFTSGRGKVKRGDIVSCSVLVVGAKRCLLTCGGFDIPMRVSEMSYASIIDMREVYRPGQEVKARVVEVNTGEDTLLVSPKLAMPNPFVGAERRHPVGSRRQAVITGKYGGGVFCTLPDDTICLCKYSNTHADSDFLIGDSVIVYIAQYNYERQHIYGRIIAKW